MLFRSLHTMGEASKAGGRCASPPGNRIAFRPAKPLKRRCSNTLAISATVSLCVYTAWKKRLRSALRRWYRRIPHPVARQRPGIDPQIRARDHGGIVGGKKHRGFGVVRWTGALAEWHSWRGSAEEATPAWAGV